MPRSMRIAMISEHASPLAAIGGVDAGGQNIYVSHVSQCLARAGHQIDVLTRRDSPHLAARVDMRPGLRVIHIDAGPPWHVPKEALLEYMPEFSRAAEQLMRNSIPYDVVHAHFFMSGWVARCIQQDLGIPFVMTFHALGLVRLQHQQEADVFPRDRLSIERDLATHADALIPECPQDQADLIRLYGADPDRMTMVPCGFDAQEFAPMGRVTARAALGWAPDEFIVLQLGRLVPRKGIDNVIRSIAELPHGMPVRLVVVGGETRNAEDDTSFEMRRLRQMASDHGVSDRVTFTGHRGRSELRRYYAAADVFVTTPWYEPFGITPLEAMACGIPVIGSDVGGIKFSVQDDIAGYLISPRDPKTLAQRLATLWANPLKARAMGRAGLARARTMFTWERVASELAEVYRQVGGGRAKSVVIPPRRPLASPAAIAP
jgi:D-inositol-3-phosphate glycosyltransferase